MIRRGRPTTKKQRPNTNLISRNFRRKQKAKGDNPSTKRETQARFECRTAERKRKEKGASPHQSVQAALHSAPPQGVSLERVDSSHQSPSQRDRHTAPATKRKQPSDPLVTQPRRKLYPYYPIPPPPFPRRARSDSKIDPAQPNPWINGSRPEFQKKELTSDVSTNPSPAELPLHGIDPQLSESLLVEHFSPRSLTKVISRSGAKLSIQKNYIQQRPAEKSFLDLPAELRNEVYEYVSPASWQITGAQPDHMNISAINLARANRQIKNEMHVLPYALAEVHVYDWGVFVLWLKKRNGKQRLAIKILFIHVIIFLEDLRDDDILEGGASTHRIRAQAFEVWPTLDALKKVIVCIHPYRQTLQPALRDPRLEMENAVWTIRAHNIAKGYTVQVRLLHERDDVEFVGRWSEPKASPELDHMVVCLRSGSAIQGAEGYRVAHR